MALKDTCKTLKTILETILADLDKAEAGNKAAAQRVRTYSIKFEKAAKLYRKESIKADKSGVMKKTKEAARKKPAGKKKSAKPSATKPSAAKPSTAKPLAAKTSSKPAKKRAPAKKVATARKKPTAKLPKAGRKKK
jgi:hypothetical protein